MRRLNCQEPVRLLPAHGKIGSPQVTRNSNEKNEFLP